VLYELTKIDSHGQAGLFEERERWKTTRNLEELLRSGSFFLLVASATVTAVLVSLPPVSVQSDEQASPVFGVKIPPGYRDWKLISVAHEEGDFNQLRAQLGNEIAIKAYRGGKLPFPDGAIIVALHWKRVPSEEANKAFGRVQAFVSGSPVNLQVMVKDSKRYAATGGWGFGDFWDGKPGDEGMHKACFFPLPRACQS